MSRARGEGAPFRKQGGGGSPCEGGPSVLLGGPPASWEPSAPLPMQPPPTIPPLLLTAPQVQAASPDPGRQVLSGRGEDSGLLHHRFAPPRGGPHPSGPRRGLGDALPSWAQSPAFVGKCHLCWDLGAKVVRQKGRGCAGRASEGCRGPRGSSQCTAASRRGCTRGGGQPPGRGWGGSVTHGPLQPARSPGLKKPAGWGKGHRAATGPQAMLAGPPLTDASAGGADVRPDAHGPGREH